MGMVVFGISIGGAVSRLVMAMLIVVVMFRLGPVLFAEMA